MDLVVASTTAHLQGFPFEQFGMSVPNVTGFVSVQDHATMEFDLRLSRG